MHDLVKAHVVDAPCQQEVQVEVVLATSLIRRTRRGFPRFGVI